MKSLLLFSLFLPVSLLTSAPFASQSIIDTELMNHDVWSEPYFPSEEELVREPSSDGDQPVREYVKNADEYLDVLKKIPASEPTITRSWIEYKILHED